MKVLGRTSDRLSKMSIGMTAAAMLAVCLMSSVTVDQAMAAKGGNARAATTQTKVSSGTPGARADAVRATTTGTQEKRCLPGSGHMCRK